MANRIFALYRSWPAAPMRMFNYCQLLWEQYNRMVSVMAASPETGRLRPAANDPKRSNDEQCKPGPTTLFGRVNRHACFLLLPVLPLQACAPSPPSFRP